MSFGGYRPYPRRFGGGKPRLEIIHESLNAQRGSAFDASNPDTIVWLENMAIARALCFDGWGTNERLSYQWDPDRMTDMLPRWEKIFRIVPPPTANGNERRAVIRARFRRFLDVTALHSRLYTKLSEVLGPAFYAIEYISVANAVVHVPDATYPWGTVAAGFPWYSTVAHMLVRLQKPTGWTEGDFYEAAGKVAPTLDPIVPAWLTFDWYRASECGAPIAVVGGPSAAGFYLDCPHNLGNQVFHV